MTEEARVFTLQPDSYKIMEGRDEDTNPAMASWNAIADCFQVRSGGADGWPNGAAILEKASQHLSRLPEALATAFLVGLEFYRLNKKSQLPPGCRLCDEKCKPVLFYLTIFILTFS